jgi:transposase
MQKIETIRELKDMGYGPVDISEKVSINRKTAAKYMGQEDYSTWNILKAENPSKLDPWKNIIESWLEEDRKMRYKQRHTAQRVHNRLTGEYPDYNGSYTLIQRYLKKRKAEIRKDAGFLELIWHPGEAQADFGEADLLENGIKKTFKYLCLSFPQSNAAYVQLFGGETAECVAEGMKDIFERIERVPTRIIFDNASGVGRKIGEKVRFAEMFMRFKCHYGFQVTFCNPNSGHEKGNVENKVGYIRRNYFVPMPAFENIEEYNKELLLRSESDWERKHYKKGVSIAALFQADKDKMLYLPSKPFEVERFERLKTDGYGKFCIDGKHYYSSRVEWANQEIVVGIKAHDIIVYDFKGEKACVHTRAFGETRTDQTDYSTTIERLIKHPNAWMNSGLRQAMCKEVRDKMDGLPKDGLREALRALNGGTKEYGFETALLSLKEAISRDSINTYDLKAICARIAIDGLNAIPDKGPDLLSYDLVFLKKGSEL